MASTVITSPTYDPTTTAENLANAYIAGSQAILDKQTTKATATATALTTLNSALSTFQSTLQSLTSSTTSVTSNSATFSDTSVATATAKSGAAAGTYSFYVQQLATAGQVSYNVADSAATNAGSMNVVLADGSNFTVDLANADSNSDGVLSAKEVAAAINTAAANDSRVTASTMTVNGTSKLVLTSTATGVDNAVASIDVSGLGDSSLQSSLSSQSVLTTATNAIVLVGGKNGTSVEQASNTFDVIDNVSFTIKEAQASTDSAVTLTVAADTSGTATNVQTFIDAYNTLLSTFTTLTKAGDHTIVESTSTSTSTTTTPTATSEDAAFYNDSGVQALRDRLAQALRAVTNGQSLISYGISASSDGTLTLDTARLNKTIAANPGAIDSLFGRAGTGVDAGALGTMNKLVTAWTSSTGYIATRTDANTKLQSDLTDRQATLKTQFDNAYKRYLAQYTALQSLQSSMTTTSNMFTALFDTSSS
ncbi:flagellar filament capping protein FliD [Duganella sp. FT80W]|uniref:Flagellar hook-associated protein 2 n=1 Tax=Duganella guangzhouensis TaxID=2666084 RepID=A0A6I2KZ03_9BURK|nr:flagellar filament capping protein FliD [Duganella guangzhouensis]MRW90750.1 flagellar filament capping protein FliD [Duganella guangzhouensis]